MGKHQHEGWQIANDYCKACGEKVNPAPSSERDELINMIDKQWARYGSTPERTVDSILDAGYHKPRTITTRDELDALQDESVILNHDLIRKVAADEYRFMDGDGWGDGSNVRLPVTLLWEPDAWGGQ